MATMPSHFPAFPSATTYPPHPCSCYYPAPIAYPSPIQIHGDYYPPPPYLAGYGSTPPTFPNLHPTPAYAPPPGFVPVPTYAPAPATPRQSPTHQHPPDLWSPPPRPSFASFPFGSCPVSAYELSSHPVLPDSSYQDVLTKNTGTGCEPIPGTTLVGTGTVPRDNAGLKNCIFVEDAALQAETDESVPTTDVTPHRLQQQEREQIFNDIQGQLAKLTTMASQLAVSIGKRSISAHTSTPAASAAAPACVVPQVFGELPTPSSGNGTGTTSPAPYASSTAVSVTPQMFGELPQQYDFQNLSRKTVFRADGTEHSYYALPESYTLEQAIPGPVFDVYDDATEDCSSACVDVSASTPEPLFSSEFVDVFASTPDQQLYEEEQPESEHSNPCLNISSDVRDFTLELQQKNDEKASVNVQQLRAPRLNLLEIDETRKELDTESNSLKYVLQSFSHPPMLRYSFILRYCSVKCNCWLNTVRQFMSDRVEGLKPVSLTTPWDPGVLVRHSGTTGNSTWTIRDAKWLKTTEDFFAEQELVANTSSKVETLTWHNPLSGTPFIGLSRTTYTWDPDILCIIDGLLDKFTVSNQVQSVQQIIYHASYIWDPGIMLLRYKFIWWLFTVRMNSEPNSFSTENFNGGKAAYYSKILTSFLSAPFKEQKEMGRLIPEQWISWFNAMQYCQLFQRCNAVSSTLLLQSHSWHNTPKAAAVYHVFKIQLPMRKTSHIWDPGIDSLMFLYIWLHIHMIQRVDSSAIYACDLVSALLPPTQFAAKGSSNIEVGELTSRYLALLLNQINDWTSIASNGIASFEYAYTMDFIDDRWELIHHQGVQENYNAEHLLLSSQDCVKIREIDIIFMTFQPP